MTFTFFSKTDKTPRKRFFNPVSDQASSSSSDSLVGVGGQDKAGRGNYDRSQAIHSFRHLRFLPPKKSLEELLEKLLRQAEICPESSRSNYLEQMLNLLKSNSDLINRVPNKFHSNPLELVIRLGEFKFVEELLKLKANVRPENRALLKKVEHLLSPNKNKDNVYSFGEGRRLRP